MDWKIKLMPKFFPEKIFDFPFKDKKNKGFTLTEIAIVLGIIGLILGAVWVAASAVYTNMRVSKALTETAHIVQAIRSVYAGQNAIDSMDGIDETSSFIAAKVFPSDSISPDNTTVYAPWTGSTITIISTTINVVYINNAPGFIINFVNIPQSACISMLVSATGASRDTGFIQINTSSSGFSSFADSLSFPFSANRAAIACPNDGMTVSLNYILNP